MSNNILFLDDSDNRLKLFKSHYPHATLVSTASECIEQLQKQSWNIVFLDHDLSGETFVSESLENSGSGVVRWIVANKPEIELIIIHSFNIVAAGHMEMDLLSAEYTVQRVPFSLSSK